MTTHTNQSSPRFHAPVLAFHRLAMLVLGLFAGCGTTTEDTACDPANPCPLGEICDLQRMICVVPSPPSRSDAGLQADAQDAAVEDAYGADGGPDDGPDAAEPDAAADADLTPVDAPPPPPPPCTGPESCSAPLPVCDLSSGLCVLCLRSTDCATLAAPICTAEHACVPCSAAANPDAACSERANATPRCDRGSGRCVACNTNADCGSASTPICGPEKTCISCAAATDPNAACAARDASAPFCHRESGRCRPCLEHRNCANPATPICLATECVACNRDANTRSMGCRERNPALGVCKEDSGTCVECTSSANCTDPLKPICQANQCVPCGMASGNACRDKNTDLPMCNAAAGTCVACLQHSHCPAATPSCLPNGTCGRCDHAQAAVNTCSIRSAASPDCNPTDGRCVECASHARCTTDTFKPVCVNNVCATCTSDAQCAAKLGADPGICLDHLGGRCAVSPEVVYVEARSNCSDDPNVTAVGSAARPFCSGPAALPFVTAERPILRLRGARNAAGAELPQAPISFQGTSPPSISVIGQNDAWILPAGFPGISVSNNARVYVRGLRIGRGGTYSSTSVGLTVYSGGVLHLTRSLVVGNPGGIIINGGAYHISNTAFVDNAGTFGMRRYGGILVMQSIRDGGRSNTVVHNSFITLTPLADTAAVICQPGNLWPVAGVGNLVSGYGALAGQTGPFDTACNMPPPCCSGTNIIRDRMPDESFPEFHLRPTATQCINQAPVDTAPVLDLDGQLRPHGALADCGADEYYP